MALEMEVLLEFQQSRQEMKLTHESACKDIKEALLIEKNSRLLPFDENCNTEPVFILQKWSQRWNKYVNISSPSDIESGNQLQVVRIPATPSVSLKGALNACSKVKKPNEEQAKTLAKLFPLSTQHVSTPKAKRAFDPSRLDPSILEQKRKKKKSNTATRPYKLWVVVLNKRQEKVPKAASRKKLKELGRIKKLEFRRSFSKQQVKDLLIKNFPDLKMLNCNFYKSGSDTVLTMYEVEGEYPDGEEVVDIASKESLYIVESQDTCFDDNSEHLSLEDKKLIKKANSILTLLKKPLTSESDSEQDLPQISVTGNRSLVTATDKPPVVSISGNPPLVSVTRNPLPVSIDLTGGEECIEKSDKEDLEATRRLIREQDELFEESLRIDREKALRKEQESQHREENEVQLKEENERIGSLRSELRQQFSLGLPSSDDPVFEDSVTISFRLPTSQRLEHNFRLSASSKMLYEFVFAYGDVPSGFEIYNLIPRKVLPMNNTPFCISTSTTLVVEWTDESITSFAKQFDIHQEYTSQDSAMMLECIPQDSVDVLSEESLRRQRFMELIAIIGNIHEVERSSICDSLFSVYQGKDVAKEFPIRFRFKGEAGLDSGGVGRDVYGTFWEEVYKILFDGVCCVIPTMNPNTDILLFKNLGAILSHGYLVTGFLPVMISFPSISVMLLGTGATISDDILVESFLKFVCNREAMILRDALRSQSFSDAMKTKLTEIVSSYNCFSVPSPSDLKALLSQIAKFELVNKPLSLLLEVNKGIPDVHSSFWIAQDVDRLYKLYESMTCSSEKVLSQLSSDPQSPAEQRILRYFEQFVGNLSVNELSTLLRFITGLPVCSDRKIRVTFNSLSGLCRRPIAHTCMFQLELPTTYISYKDFSSEMVSILDMCNWRMDSI